ncbi:hypothetical protein BDD12DRAFT_800642 [Trichophaea hybrida]|nr:hypothetical protein BDD12DRAFT_800642 [Trichophaea hybrida]
MSNIMTPIMPDLRCTKSGISSPRSSTEGYSCAFPSWPNRPWLDSRRPYPELSSSSPRHAIPSVEFLDSLRRRPRPEQTVFEEDEDDSDDCAIAESVESSSSTYTNSDPVLPSARHTVQRTNSLLSKAFSQLQQNGKRVVGV